MSGMNNKNEQNEITGQLIKKKQKTRKPLKYILIILVIAVILTIVFYINSASDTFSVLNLSSSEKDFLNENLDYCINEVMHFNKDGNPVREIEYDICNAIIENTVPDCTQSDNITECFDSYYYLLALKDNDKTNCEKINDIEDKTACRVSFEQNPDCNSQESIDAEVICNLMSGNTGNIYGISDLEYKNFEKIYDFMVSLKTQDIEKCQSMTEEGKKYLCLAVVSNQKSYCNEFKKIICADNTYYYLMYSYSIKNPLICDKMDDIDTKIKCLNFVKSP